MPSERRVRKRTRPGRDTVLMPYLHVTEDTVSERQWKHLVTKRYIPGTTERQSDQRTIVDSGRDHNAFSDYQCPQRSCPQNLKNSDQCHSSDMYYILFFVISPGKYFSTFQLYMRCLKTKLIFILHYISQTNKKSCCFIDWFGQSRSFFYQDFSITCLNACESRDGKKRMKINHVIWPYHFLGSLYMAFTFKDYYFLLQKNM